MTDSDQRRKDGRESQAVDPVHQTAMARDEIGAVLEQKDPFDGAFS